MVSISLQLRPNPSEYTLMHCKLWVFPLWLGNKKCTLLHTSSRNLCVHLSPLQDSVLQALATLASLVSQLHLDTATIRLIHCSLWSAIALQEVSLGARVGLALSAIHLSKITVLCCQKRKKKFSTLPSRNNHFLTILCSEWYSYLLF